MKKQKQKQKQKRVGGIMGMPSFVKKVPQKPKQVTQYPAVRLTQREKVLNKRDAARNKSSIISDTIIFNNGNNPNKLKQNNRKPPIVRRPLGFRY